MVARFREKIALAVFFGLAILGFCSLIGYLMLGYSWNVTATNIDDATGSLKGYTAIIFEGISSQVSGKESPPSDEEDEPDEGSETNPVEADEPDEGSETGLDGAEGADADSSDAPILHDEAISSLNTLYLAVEDVRESYLEKESEIVVLDIADFNKYTGGLILKKGNHRFGVFPVDRDTSSVEIRQTLSYLEKHEVDFILALTSDRALVEKYSSIDIVISTNPKDAISSGETSKYAFHVSTPVEGSVGVILISPSNVVSAKVLTEV